MGAESIDISKVCAVCPLRDLIDCNQARLEGSAVVTTQQDLCLTQVFRDQQERRVGIAARRRLASIGPRAVQSLIDDANRLLESCSNQENTPTVKACADNIEYRVVTIAEGEKRSMTPRPRRRARTT